MTRKTFWALFTIAAVLRIFMIDRAPLWYDENFTLILARLPFVDMIKATAGDVHPPLWYIVEWIIFHVAPGLPAWFIRVPAVIFSLLAFMMFVHVCNVLYIPGRVHMVAAAMMAVMPMQIWYAQEGRMYAMLEFLVLATLWIGVMRRWTLFFISALALLYTQNYGMFYLATIGIVLFLRDWRWISTTPLVKASVFAGLLYAPWVFVIASQMTEINGRYWIMNIGPGAVLNSIYKQFWAGSMLEAGTVGAYVVTFAVLIIGIYTLAHDRLDWPVLALAFGPLGLALIVSIVWQPLLLFRPLIGISPFLYIIAAWSVLNLADYKQWPAPKLKTAPTVYASVFILPVLMMGIGGYYLNIANMKGEGAVSPLLDTLTYVRKHWQPGDVIYYTDDGPMVNLMPYAADLPQYRMPACDERIGFAPVLGSLSNTTREAMHVDIEDLNDITWSRAWVFAPRSPLHPQCYEDQIKDLAAGPPLILVDDNAYLTSGVWLVDEGVQ